MNKEKSALLNCILLFMCTIVLSVASFVLWNSPSQSTVLKFSVSLATVIVLMFFITKFADWMRLKQKK